jgi:predicted Zn-dependent peptidase
VSTAVRSDITDAAAKEILLEIDRMRAQAIAAGRAVARDELSRRRRSRFGSRRRRHRRGAVRARDPRLPEDYYDTYRERVRAMTVEQILQAAQRYLHPESLQMVAVGDPAAIKGPLEKLGFNATTVYDTLGKPIAG